MTNNNNLNFNQKINTEFGSEPDSKLVQNQIQQAKIKQQQASILNNRYQNKNK